MRTADEDGRNMATLSVFVWSFFLALSCVCVSSVCMRVCPAVQPCGLGVLTAVRTASAAAVKRTKKARYQAMHREWQHMHVSEAI